MFSDDTVTEQDVVLEKTYPMSLHKLVRIHQANNWKSQRLSVLGTIIPQIKQLNPRQSFWYNKTKIRRAHIQSR